MTYSLARANVGYHWKLFLSAVSVLALSGCLIYISVGVISANIRSFSAFNRTLADIDFYVRAERGAPDGTLNAFLSDAVTFDSISRVGELPPSRRGRFTVGDSTTTNTIQFRVLDPSEDALMVPVLVTDEARRALSVPGTMLAAANLLERHNLSIGDIIWNEANDFGLEIVGSFESTINRDFIGQRTGYGFVSYDTMRLFEPNTVSRGFVIIAASVIGLEHVDSLTRAQARARIQAQIGARQVELLAPEDFHRNEMFRGIRENKQFQGFLLMGAFAILIPLVIIVQTLRAAIISQAHQFATLRALGIPARHLISTAMEQAFWVGVLGAATSYCLMMGVQIGLKPHQIDMYVDGRLLVIVTSAILAAAFLAGLISVFALFKMKPQDLLR